MEAHPSAAQEVKMLVSKVIDFLRRMRKYFNEYYSQKMQSIRRHFAENHQKGFNEMPEETVKNSDVKADIAVVDTVEFIYGSAENFFPELQINDVRERVNGFLGTNVTKRQVYAKQLSENWQLWILLASIFLALSAGARKLALDYGWSDFNSNILFIVSFIALSIIYLVFHELSVKLLQPLFDKLVKKLGFVPKTDALPKDDRIVIDYGATREE